ncbi:phage late control D family protein, partial [Marinagarivorans algicola]|uniref:phage late control D family protein n=1 Tax=Marinagarivorans algicola TaxID=1513270 RepID=UPI003735C3FE
MGLVFKVEAGGKDITRVIAQNLEVLRVTDKAGTQSDALAIVLAAERSIALPPAGVALNVSLGFGEVLRPKGRFVVGGISESGWPRKITIEASAASLNSDKGEAVMQSQKTRAWEAISLSDIVQKIAAEHGLVPKVSAEFAAVIFDHLDQTAESDLNFLRRLAIARGAIMKPANGFLLFVTEGVGKSASGVALPVVSLSAAQCSAYSYKRASAKGVKRVTANYSDDSKGVAGNVEVGAGEP